MSNNAGDYLKYTNGKSEVFMHLVRDNAGLSALYISCDGTVGYKSIRQDMELFMGSCKRIEKEEFIRRFPDKDTYTWFDTFVSSGFSPFGHTA